MTRETIICRVCQQGHSYERKYRPRLYCDTCRGPVYKAHATAPYDPAYAKWYRENVLKPKRAAALPPTHRPGEAQ